MTKKGVPYQHISFAERVKIETLIDQFQTCETIAGILNRSVNTVYEEIGRNSDGKAAYTAKEAQEKTQFRRASANRSVHKKMVPGTPTYKKVIAGIKHYESPDQIIGKYQTSRRFTIRSPQTLYSYIAKENPLLKVYLRRGNKKYRKNHTKAKYLSKNSKRAEHSIEHRPQSIENRKRVGHWEGDTIIGQEKTSRFLTMVERKTGFLVAKKIDGDVSGTVAKKTIATFRKLPRKLKKTMTYDNGSEFAEYLSIEEKLKMDIYFAHPYHSWERGTNENTNGLLRQFYPKGTNFARITQRDLDKKVNMINTRPRKRLNYLSPKQALNRELLV